MRSLRGRLLALSALWTALALAVAWAVLSDLFADFVARRLDAELDAAAEAVMAAAAWDEAGALVVDPAAADPRFERPYSGWYWQVEAAEGQGARALARSRSLVTSALDTAAAEAGGRLTDREGAALIAHARPFTAPGGSERLVVTATMPEALRRAEIAGFARTLAVALSALGAGLLLAALATVTLGLRGLDRLAGEIAALREAGLGRLSAPSARELRPLAAEINRLIDANETLVGRTRAHVGNLAHALRTPLSALSLRMAEDAQASDLLTRMERLTRWHLTRAQAAARAEAPTRSTPVAPALDDLAQVLAPEARRRGVRLAIEARRDLAFRGAREDLEEMAGNLMENAVKWAATEVRVIAAAEPGGRLGIEVRDDGPGIAPQARERVLSRGARIDSHAAPGFGLGLAIVADLVALHGGTLSLDAADPPPGLRARLVLPATSRARGEAPPRTGRAPADFV